MKFCDKSERKKEKKKVKQKEPDPICFMFQSFMIPLVAKALICTRIAQVSNTTL